MAGAGALATARMPAPAKSTSHSGGSWYKAAMRGAPRKTTPRVKDGWVQRKNHRDEWTVDDGPLEVVTEVPEIGRAHV